MMTQTNPMHSGLTTIQIDLPAKASAEEIKRLLNWLEPVAEASETNRQAWNKLVEALEDAQDNAAFDAWEADGRPAGIPLEQVLKENKLDIEELKREL